MPPLPQTTLKKALLTAIFMMFGGGLVTWSMVASPKLAEMRQITNELKAQKKKEDQIKRIAALETKAASYRRLFADPKALTALTDVMNQLAAESGLALVSLSPSPIGRIGNYSVIRYTIDLAGTYHEIGQFAARVESHTPFLRMEGLRIESAEPGKDELKAQMLISAYLGEAVA